MSKLTAKQAKFVSEYLIDLNATQAAIRTGYNPKTAYSQGQRLLKNVEVMKAIKAAQDKRAEKTQINAEYVLRRHAEIDQMDLLDIMTDEGGFKPLHDWPKIWRQFLSGVDVSEIFEGGGNERQIVGVLKKIKWPDKLRNLELLGKHVDVGAYREQLRTEGDLIINVNGKLANV